MTHGISPYDNAFTLLHASTGSSRSAAFLLTLFENFLLLRKEKLFRLVLVRDLQRTKQSTDNLPPGFFAGPHHAGSGGEHSTFASADIASGEKDKIGAAIVQLKQNLTQLRQAATRNDLTISQLQQALTENLELRVLSLELQRDLVLAKTSGGGGGLAPSTPNLGVSAQFSSVSPTQLGKKMCPKDFM